MLTDKMLEDPLAIDQLNLPWEYARQPELVGEFAEREARAQARLDEAEVQLELAEEDRKEVEATVLIAVVNDPASAGLAKSTETVVKAAVRVSAAYRAATARVTAAKRHVNKLAHAVRMMAAVRRGLSDKRTSLEKTTDLALAGIYAAPRQPKDPAAREQFQEQSRRPVSRTGGRPEGRAGDKPPGGG